jgi:hypothetical protein
MGINDRIQQAIALHFANPANAVCILCQKKCTLRDAGVFFPPSLEAWGVQAGKSRVIIYAACSTCRADPMKIENKIFSQIAARALGSARN